MRVPEDVSHCLLLQWAPSSPPIPVHCSLMGGVPEIRVLVSHDVYVQTLGYVHLYVCVCVLVSMHLCMIDVSIHMSVHV